MRSEAPARQPLPSEELLISSSLMTVARLAAGASCLVAALALAGCSQPGPPANTGPVAFITCCTTVGMDPPTSTSHPSNGNIQIVNGGEAEAVLDG